MIKMKHFCLLMLIVLIAVILVKIVSAPVYSKDTSQAKILQYKSLLTELNQTTSSDKKLSTEKILAIKNMISEIPSYLLFQDVKNRNNNLVYRSLVSDLLYKKVKYMGKENFNGSFMEFKEIAIDKNEDVGIRRKLISAMTRGYLLGYNTEQSVSPKKSNTGTGLPSILGDIVKDKDENPIVVAKAIDSLSRINHREMNDDLLTILINWESEDPLLVKSASENLGRQKSHEVISILTEIVRYSENEDIFITAVYALGLTGSQEMIEPIVTNYNRFGILGKSICRGTLKKNRQLLLDILSEERQEFMIPSVIALGIIREKAAIPYLNHLLNYDDQNKEIILEAINQIQE